MGASPPLQPRQSTLLDDRQPHTWAEVIWRAYLRQLRLHGLRTKVCLELSALRKLAVDQGLLHAVGV